MDPRLAGAKYLQELIAKQGGLSKIWKSIVENPEVQRTLGNINQNFERLPQHFKNETGYVNPANHEHYSFDYSDPLNPVITAAYAGDTKGTGSLNPKLFAMMFNEGLLSQGRNLQMPSTLGVKNIVEEHTLKGIMNADTDLNGVIDPDALHKALWGHTIDRLAQMYGGRAGDIQMGASDQFSNIGNAISKGIDPHNKLDVLGFLGKYIPDIERRPMDAYGQVDFRAPLKGLLSQ